MQRWIQGLEIFLAHPRQASRQGHVNIVADVHGLEVGVVLDQWQFGAIGVGTGHDVFHRLQLGDIHACLARQGQIGIAGAQARLLVAGDGAAYAAFPPVVGRQSQVPITKHAVKLLQIVQCRACRGEYVAPVIAESVLFEIEIIARGGHELPHARSLGRGNRLRVEGAFNIGQQRQLGRHAPAFQFFDDMEQVLA